MTPPDAAGASPRDGWWKEGVVYQIYPRSFADGNGDGMGDLRGIIGRLDHLAELGIDIVWLCPVYPSPNVDNGYDVADYRGIAPEFGSMADFEELVREMDRRGLRLVMDLVFNHSSDRHPWFVSARSSRKSPYRDYYIWRDGPPDRPPNDWRAVFGGSAWTWNGPTGDWYFHIFAPEQPDLNWENPALRRELWDIMRFWAGKGVSGFRLDVIPFVSKKPFDQPQEGPIFAFYANGPKVHDYLREMRREVLAPLGLMTVGEAPGVSADEAPLFVDPARGELDMIFHFDHAGIDRAPEDFWTPSPWRLSDLKDVLARWDEALDGRGWGSLYLGNHDLPRMVSRFGDRGEYRVQSAKLLATLLLTLRGTPYIYQGDEIGMANCPFAAIDDYRDIAARNKWLEGRAQGRDPAALLADLALVGRDHARTPMQWDGSAHAGFSRAEPWIGVNPDHDVVNVAAQRSDPGSVLSHYRRLIALRKATPALRKGDFEVIASAEAVFAYRRRLVDDQVVVVLNFSPLPQPLPELSPSAEWALGNYPASAGGLRPWEARVLRLVPVRAYASPACSMHEVDPDYMGLPDEPPRGA